VPPKIRFFAGPRGQRIAYAVDGRGPTLVLPAWWVSHVERDFDEPGFAALFTELAGSMTVVRYDRAGVGLSDRQRDALTLDEELAVLSALIDELGSARVALFGGSCGGPPAIAYAARHPERVSHLVLFGAYACGARLATAEVKEAMVGLVLASWGLGAKALFDLFAPEHTSDERARFAALQREWAAPEMAARLLALTYEMDVSALLGDVQVPTLVLHREGDHAIAFEHGRELAARIPGAQLRPLPGNAHLPWLGDWRAVAEALLEFVAAGPGEPAADNTFRREGEVWRVTFAGQRGHFKHARGLSDLAWLLAHPGHEFAAAALMDGGPPPPPLSHEPLLDEQARGELRQRLRDLDERIAAAEAAGSEAAALRAAEEKSALVRQLRVTTGLGGRRRTFADASERARKAVSGRIRDSIDKIGAQLPELGRHLAATISTGNRCAYRPPQPIVWLT
jgi:pimeloyl-ACP methyl ester carboxylesterase